jgi:squalene-hopene/tetraprenyl-beta-curcumene cyclase
MDGTATGSRTLENATAWLLRRQDPEGFWEGMVETNSCMEAEWLLASHILGTTLPMRDGFIRAILQRQRPDGSWDIYHGAPAGDINSTVEVYAALRAMGFDPERPELQRARAWILAHGGLRNVRVFTRYWLAMIGVWPWRNTPNLPPEMIVLPRWFPFNIYHFAQWARATMVPIMLLSARRPVCPLPGGIRLEELFPEGIDAFDFSIPPKQSGFFTLERLFEAIDHGLHTVQSNVKIPLRETAITLCREWIVRHQDWDGAWGGIQPPWIYSLLALHNEGYAIDHPVIAKGLAALGAHWTYERHGAVHVQATDSSVWDTLYSLLALHEAGHAIEETPAMRKALTWILDHQVLVKGDWSLKLPNVEPGGWAFERANAYYPDVDDTAMALVVLGKIVDASGAFRPRVTEAIRRGVGWMIAMQSKGGGWGAFDKDNDQQLISKIPFCNFGEALDPPSVDVTGHVLEAFGVLGFDANFEPVRRGLAFIRAEQESDGSWFGRWGVNYLYGAGAVLPGLRAIGEDMNAEYVRRAAAFVVSRQNADGGWGESCDSYMVESSRGRGTSTASQTSWAMLALLSVDAEAYRGPIARGAAFLAETQTAEGTWDEPYYTGTGFPGYGVGVRLDLKDPELTS